jgi:hypothetical protein
MTTLFIRWLLVRVPFFPTSTVQRFPNFPCYLAPDFTHYISERLEMIFSQQEVTEGQNKKEKLERNETYEDKIN